MLFFQASKIAFCVFSILSAYSEKGEGTSLHEGGLYLISRQNESKLGTHLLIDANETDKERKSNIFNSLPQG
jgi:hypothetical protein